MLPEEDLQGMNHGQAHEPVDFDEDWLVCVVEPILRGVEKGSGS